METMNRSGETKEQTEAISRATPTSKRSYQTPLLREWGSVAGLTLAGAGAIPELYVGSQLG